MNSEKKKEQDESNFESAAVLLSSNAKQRERFNSIPPLFPLGYFLSGVVRLCAITMAIVPALTGLGHKKKICGKERRQDLYWPVTRREEENYVRERAYFAPDVKRSLCFSSLSPSSFFSRVFSWFFVCQIGAGKGLFWHICHGFGFVLKKEREKPN